MTLHEDFSRYSVAILGFGWFVGFVGRYLVLLGGKKGKWWIPSGVRKNVACWKIACLSMILPAINLYHPLIYCLYIVDNVGNPMP